MVRSDRGQPAWPGLPWRCEIPDAVGNQQSNQRATL